MNYSENAICAVEKLLLQIENLFVRTEELEPLTDLLFKFDQTDNALIALDDEENELAREVVEEWTASEGGFDEKVAIDVLRQAIANQKDKIDSLFILKPFSLVWLNEETEETTEIYRVDDDNLVIENDLMKNLDADLNAFWEKLNNDIK